jgi:dTDP-4-dehydrorhamnose 3,5-epimerase
MGQIRVTKAPIEGLYIIEPTKHGDSRGYFVETYNARDMKEFGLDMVFVQDNQSMSLKGVLRGLHFQIDHPQGKLVRVIRGEVFDVAVDLRKGSPTYGQHVTCLLAAHDEEGERFAKELGEEVTSSISPLPSYIGLQFFVPRGFAHGFAVLSDTAIFQYKCDEFYHSEADGGISILDDSLGIDWRI